jgi:hypothetical protein
VAKKNKAGPGPCTHCLVQCAERTWDHVFPVSWYPDTTPENLERWKFPACEPCNAAYGRLEQDLLLRAGLALDSSARAASGIPGAAFRAIDPAHAKNEVDRRAREARRQRLRDETFVVGPEHLRAILPGFGPHPGPPVGVYVAAESLERLVEKVARGLTYLHAGRLITPEYRVVMFVDPRQGAAFEQLLATFGRRYDRGPGIAVAHAIANDDSRASIFSLVLWGSLHLWGAVQPKPVIPPVEQCPPAQPTAQGA